MSLGLIHKRQAGLTLIELMISLALGLIVVAAAIMLFLTGQKSYSLQQGSADLQDNANFGLSYVTKDIRLANLNALSAEINDRTKAGGLVLTSKDNGYKDTAVTPNKIYSNLPDSVAGKTAAVATLSASESHSSNVKLAGTDLKSDQLVIQYKPQYTTDPDTAANWFGGFDCEGDRISFAKSAPQRIIVQRYFLREDDNKNANEPNQALALACDAGWYNESGNPAEVEDYGGEGEIIMKRVDYFRVLLGIQKANDHRYIAVKDYMNLSGVKPRILSIQLGVLVRSSQSVGNDALVKNDQKFQVLDNEVTVKIPANASTKYVRQVVSQTIALRNTFGERGR